MDKKQLEELFDDYFGCNLQRSKTVPTMDEVNVKRFIFDTIIPNVLYSMTVQASPHRCPYGYGVSDTWAQAINNYIKDSAKILYDINLQPFTFIPSQTTKGK